MHYNRAMHNFEHRRDRYDTFRHYANPLINIAMDLELPDFRPWCKARALPPFHVFLHCLLMSLRSIDNFMYRIYRDEVIKIDEFYASYTVVNDDDNLNYARFDMCDELGEFVRRSVAAGAVARASRALINTAADLTEREQRNNFYVTCLPWVRMTAIEHPIYCAATADVPLIAWGQFGPPAGGRFVVPFSVQAHHGFVDGLHIYQLGLALSARIDAMMAA